MDKPKTFVKLLFIDFSSAFNTTQTHILVEKLINEFGLDFSLLGWILDFLVQRTQRVKVNDCFSEWLVSSTGSPQGCVISPLLFILYTNDCKSSYRYRHIIKFADDSVIVSLMSEEDSMHGPVVDDFIMWCQNTFLKLNVSKTKEMIIDFNPRRKSTHDKQTSINGVCIESVEQYKYLGTVLDNKLSFSPNTEVLCKRGQQRLYCLRKLRSFNVGKTLMCMFYRSYIESLLSFSLLCWFNYLNVKNKNCLERIVNQGSKITGSKQMTMAQLYHRQVLGKAQSILLDDFHPMYQEFNLLPSGIRYRTPISQTNRFRHSFIPSAVKFLNLR